MGGVAKNGDSYRSSRALATAHSIFCFSITLKVWGFPGRRQSQGSQWHLSSQVSLWVAVFLIVLHWILEAIQPRLSHFRDGEVEAQREEELPQVALESRSPILPSGALSHRPTILGASPGLHSRHQMSPALPALRAFRLLLERLPYTHGGAWDEESEDFA